MKKEEFLAISLPFGLKMQSKINKNEIFNVYGIELNEGLFHADTDEYSWYCIDMFKPVLHPMSDLTKTIERNGEKFVPLHRLLEHSSFNLGTMTNKDIMEFADIYSNVDLITVNDLPLYLEWKFDIAGLIDIGEAIDVNILKINPYK